jgi:LemA protein
MISMYLLSTSFAFWTVAAVMLFWALGAYNRLMRLRAEMVRELRSLALQWQHHAQAVRQELTYMSHAPESDVEWVNLHDDVTHWHPLAMATRQFQLCIAALLVKPQTMPLGEDIASLRLAHEVMDDAWARLKNTHEDLAGAAVPARMAQLWQQQDVLVHVKKQDYNRCTSAYNDAISQFPAVVLAWIFSFKAGQCI